MQQSPQVEAMKKRLLSDTHDPELFAEFRSMMMHTDWYPKETREELMKIARTRRVLFTSKQWKHIQNGFEAQLELNRRVNYDDNESYNGCPELISEYDYEEYF